MDASYRKAVIHSVITLHKFQDELFGSMVSIAFNNEFKYLDDVFEVGDVYGFSIEQFEDSKDINVSYLADIIKDIRSKIVSIENLNNISDEELEQHK